jgi:hypothetical protein
VICISVLSVCLWGLSVCESVCLYCLTVRVCDICLCGSVYLSACLSACLSVCGSVCLSVCGSTCLCCLTVYDICLYVGLSLIYLPAYLSTCLPTGNHLFTYLLTQLTCPYLVTSRLATFIRTYLIMDLYICFCFYICLRTRGTLRTYSTFTLRSSHVYISLYLSICLSVHIYREREKEG